MGLIVPGLVFEVLPVMLMVKKKAPTKKRISTKSKGKAKVVVEPLKRKKPAHLSSQMELS